MATVSDLRLAALNGEGYLGTVSDATNSWLADATGQEGSTNDLWAALFDIESVPAGSFNDRQFIWFSLFGAVGETLVDRSVNYWQLRFDNLP